MTRSLTTAQQTEVAAETGTREWLVEIEYFDGASSSYVRLTTAAQDLQADVDGTGAYTFQGTGGLLSWDGIPESADPSGQQTRLTLSGVDTTILTDIDTLDFRGRTVRVWSAQIAADGTLDFIGPYLFRQLGDYTVTETWGSGTAAGSCTITTTIESVLAALNERVAVRCNDTSHSAMLRRAGLATTSSSYFANVVQLSGVPYRLGTGGPASGPGHTTRGPGGGPVGPVHKL